MKAATVIAVALATTFLIVACSPNTPDIHTPTDGPTASQQQTVSVSAAQDTVIRFNKSGLHTAETPFAEIPEEIWTEEIKRLAPLKVYWHNNNLAVVFENFEEPWDGIYVYVPISSYWPGNVETIELALEEGKTYKFRIQE